MYETYQVFKPNLSDDTIRRMNEVFGGRTCCICGEPAERVAADKFYCGIHFVRKGTKAASTPKTYKCVLAS